MAELKPRIEGAAAEWLQAHREGLNRRFERLRRLHPRLDGERALELLSKLLPPLATTQPGGAELLASVFDLTLLHLGRDAFATHPGLNLLLGETFPRLRSLLLQRPRDLPAALSNAVENLGGRGEELARGLAALGALVQSPDELLQAGAVLAWRLGETRLRPAALDAAGALPPRAALAALDLLDWPDAAAAPAVAALTADTWCHPRRLLSGATVEKLRADPSRAGEVAARLATMPQPAAASWTVVARIGDFTGFGGDFLTPPVVLDGGDRHTFLVRCQEAHFVLHADVFGWVCRPAPPSTCQVRSTAPSAWRRLLSGMEVHHGDELSPDGVLRVGSERVRIPGLEAAVAFRLRDSVAAASFADSHRIRVATGVRRPL